MKNPVTTRHSKTVTNGALIRISLESIPLKASPFLLDFPPRNDPAFSETPSNAFFARCRASRVAMTNEQSSNCFNTTDVLTILTR